MVEECTAQGMPCHALSEFSGSWQLQPGPVMKSGIGVGQQDILCLVHSVNRVAACAGSSACNSPAPHD